MYSEERLLAVITYLRAAQERAGRRALEADASQRRAAAAQLWARQAAERVRARELRQDVGGHTAGS